MFLCRAFPQQFPLLIITAPEQDHCSGAVCVFSVQTSSLYKAAALSFVAFSLIPVTSTFSVRLP